MPFEKGQSGNPGGRVAMDPELKKAVQGWAKESLEFLAKVKDDDKAATRDRIKAAEVLIDRGFGKAIQTVDANVTESKPLTYDPAHSEADNGAK